MYTKRNVLYLEDFNLAALDYLPVFQAYIKNQTVDDAEQRSIIVAQTVNETMRTIQIAASLKLNYEELDTAMISRSWQLVQRLSQEANDTTGLDLFKLLINKTREDLENYHEDCEKDANPELKDWYEAKNFDSLLELNRCFARGEIQSFYIDNINEDAKQTIANLAELGIFVTHITHRQELTNQESRFLEVNVLGLEGNVDDYRTDSRSKSYLEFYMAKDSCWDILADHLDDHPKLLVSIRRVNGDITHNFKESQDLNQRRLHDLKTGQSTEWQPYGTIDPEDVFYDDTAIPNSVISILDDCSYFRVVYNDYEMGDVETELIQLMKPILREQKQQHEWDQVASFDEILRINRAVIERQHVNMMGLEVVEYEKQSLLDLTDAGIYLASNTVASSYIKELDEFDITPWSNDMIDIKDYNKESQTKSHVSLYLPDSAKAQAFLDLLYSDPRLAVVCVDPRTKHINYNLEHRGDIELDSITRQLKYVTSRYLYRNKITGSLVRIRNLGSLTVDSSSSVLNYVGPGMKSVLSEMLNIDVVSCNYCVTGLPNIILEHWKSLS